VKDVDVRGFVYALEPVRLRQQWHLDRLMSRLARARAELHEIETQLTRTQQAHDREAEEAGRVLLQRLDPAAHRRALAYLAQLRDRCRQLETRGELQRTACEDLRKECAAAQLRLEGLALHKENALTQYAEELRQRHGTEQDRDWLARAAAGFTARTSP
jgi:hypothetical protein